MVQVVDLVMVQVVGLASVVSGRVVSVRVVSGRVAGWVVSDEDREYGARMVGSPVRNNLSAKMNSWDIDLR